MAVRANVAGSGADVSTKPEDRPPFARMFMKKRVLL
jgi:hypothetical protein